ncbi:Glycosyltransferase involved in cell wall bisynthesis [Eubacterium aggregans]|uniref:Glycosyltransferase involved in cell wall bisynthesis n=1 Tax=Eubacterium aggregans TaxID=81409 RepID=A0A1H4D4N2_9FIRM|nr:glycosyltransferase family 2 protein [Eubacterium aggregans]SEA67496.1 Glycosyltransferase involved in cell wall bisynthesis [Eubacterium aggregans]
MNNQRLTVVVPCYNEAKTIHCFYKAMNPIRSQFSTEFGVEITLLFVDDGSCDGTINILKTLAEEDGAIQFLSFSRNFGKEAAILAGLSHASGDFVAVMDVDLQDPPELLSEMYLGIVAEGYDCVAARRVSRKGEPFIRSFFARRYYHVLNRMSKMTIVDGARDYRLMTRDVVKAVLSVKEYNRFTKGIFSWVGFETKWLEYENRQRVTGETKWSFWHLFLYSLDGVVAYSTVPLSLASVMGFILCLLAIGLIGFFIAKTLIWGDPVAGYPSLVCIVLFIGGVQLFCIGILGQYLAKTYLETKGRPIYIIKSKSETLAQSEMR